MCTAGRCVYCGEAREVQDPPVLKLPKLKELKCVYGKCRLRCALYVDWEGLTVEPLFMGSSSL